VVLGEGGVVHPGIWKRQRQGGKKAIVCTGLDVGDLFIITKKNVLINPQSEKVPTARDMVLKI